MSSDQLEDDASLMLLAGMHAAVSDGREAQKKIKVLMDKYFIPSRATERLKPLMDAMNDSSDAIDHLIRMVDLLDQCLAIYQNGIEDIKRLLSNTESSDGQKLQ